jgi:DNA-binding Lrp family transcriptional regulator
MLNLGMPSVINHVKRLEKQGFIKKEKRGVYHSYIASRSDLFKIYKRNDILIRLHESGLIDFLTKTFNPRAIALLGPASTGDDVEITSLDIFLLAKKKKIEPDLKRFEKKLGRKITLFFRHDISKIPDDLRSYITNGIVLYGYPKWS